LSGVNLFVEQGQFIAILGANGSGKSTLAKHINALLIPGGGTILVDGKDTKNPDDTWEIRKSAGMVFQNPDNQIIGQIVEEDVGFGPEYLGLSTEEIWERVAESLKAVDMYEFSSFSPNKLSGGQKQRVSIAGVLAMRPKCLILDEPTAMLDPKGRREVMDAVIKLNRHAGITVILITHFPEEAISADMLFITSKGKIAMQGSPRHVFSRPEELDELGLAPPPCTELSRMLAQRGVPLPAGILTEDELADALYSVMA